MHFRRRNSDNGEIQRTKARRLCDITSSTVVYGCKNMIFSLFYDGLIKILCILLSRRKTENAAKSTKPLWRSVPFSLSCQRHDISVTPHQRNEVKRSVGYSDCRETSVSKIRHYNRLSSSVPSARYCRIAPITPHCECGVTKMACSQHALGIYDFILS